MDFHCKAVRPDLQKGFDKMTDYTIRPPMVRAKGKQKNAFIRFLMSIFPVKGDSIMEIIRKCVFICAIVAFAITGYTLLSDVSGEITQLYIIPDQINNDKSQGSLNLSQETIDKIKTDKPYIREDLMTLYTKNSDLVGWFNLGENDQIIDHPVVQSYDNDKYLTTDFYGGYKKSGTLFVDYRAKFSASGETPNFLAIYGHNTSSGIMFSKLTRYYYDVDFLGGGTDQRLDFYQKYPTINFDTLAGEGTYKVFAAGLFNTQSQYGEVYDYLRDSRPFESKEDFNNYILDIMDRSCLFTDVDLTYGDEIICLSTCYFPFGSLDIDNVRCVIFARKVREGESPEVDVSKATTNYYWKGWQQAIDHGLTGYGKRTWDTSKLLSY